MNPNERSNIGMAAEWCARCQKAQIMNIMVSDVEKAVDYQQEEAVKVKSYYCSVCNSFIKSEIPG